MSGEGATPRTVSELGLIAERTHHGRGIRIGRRALAALVAMLENPHRTAVQNISELARDVGVDPSTLTRLGQRLGFSGFTELQEVFRKDIAERGLFYSSQAQGVIDRAEPDIPSVIQKHAKEEIDRLLETASKLGEQEVARAAQMICTADAVHVLGLRATHSIAYFFGMFASFMRPRVFIMGSSGAAIAEELAQIKENDLLVAISFRPYTQLTLDACTAISTRNISIVSLTDISSPIAGEAENHVTLRSRSPFYFNSAVSGLFVSQVLLAAVARQLGEKAVTHMSRIEGFLKELSIETE